MSNAAEHREPESLELNKETLQDLDVESNSAGNVKGGALGGDPISGVVGYTPPTLNPTWKGLTPAQSGIRVSM